MRADRITGTATALLLHAAVVVLLLQYAPAREALKEAAPLMVGLITPPASKPDVPPKPLPVKPVRREAAPVPSPTPAPLLAANTSSPATVMAPPVAPEPRAPAPVAEAVPAAVAAPQTPPPAPRPAPLTPPNFDAAYLNNPPPVYPPLARRQGWAGKVVLRVYVSAAGSAEQVEIRTSSSHALLDQAARNAVLRWRFVPARQGDQPVAAWVLVPITFTLES